MEVVEIVSIAYVFLFMALTVVFIKPKPFNSNVLKIELRLFPHWFKWVGLVVIFIVGIISYLFWNKMDLVKEMFFFNISFGLIIIAFSKERIEDEFTKYLRMKTIVVTYIVVMMMFGALLPMIFFMIETTIAYYRIMASYIFCSFWIYHLLYFYYARFRLKRELKEKL